MNNLNVAVLGATGVVGTAIIKTLLFKQLGVNIQAFASRQSELMVGEKNFQVYPLSAINFKDFDVVLSALPANVASQYLPVAIKNNCLVIDNSSFFRQSHDLIVPEVNGCSITAQTQLLASPNCIAIPLSIVLHAVRQIYALKKVDVATYQAVSGAGAAAFQELADSSFNYLNNKEQGWKNFVAPIGFNVIPYIDTLDCSGHTKEEIKIFKETRKILDCDLDLNISAVRVPVFNGHSQAVHCLLQEKVDLNKLINLFDNFSGVNLLNNSEYLTPLTHAKPFSGITISRLRKSLSNPYAFSFWMVSDNVYKGAALNVVDILENWMQLQMTKEYYGK